MRSISLVVLVAVDLTAQSGKLDTWTDSIRQQTWTASDNGSGISGLQAVRYCASLRIGGHRDWSLPTINDLQQLFDKQEARNGYRIRAPLHLSGWQWSKTPGQQRGEQWAFDFGDGGRASVMTGDSGLNRALCVRNGSK